MMDIDVWNENVHDWLHFHKFKALGIFSRSVGILTVCGVFYIIQDIIHDVEMNRR